ncbi:hypothetical protein [Arthrobacter alpinus]|nr:hypothetical protein [Arthrobacter alpinus]
MEVSSGELGVIGNEHEASVSAAINARTISGQRRLFSIERVPVS